MFPGIPVLPLNPNVWYLVKMEWLCHGIRCWVCARGNSLLGAKIPSGLKIESWVFGFDNSFDNRKRCHFQQQGDRIFILLVEARKHGSGIGGDSEGLKLWNSRFRNGRINSLPQCARIRLVLTLRRPTIFFFDFFLQFGVEYSSATPSMGHSISNAMISGLVFLGD